MNKELVSLLVCPKCQGKLEKFSEDQLRCEKCCQQYIAKDNIPVLLLD